MGKRLLASFLAAAMMLTMAPFAFAIENTEDTIDADQIPATEEAVAGENQIETKDTSTLQSAIDAANGSYTLTEDTTADITINKDLVLDLGCHTLTNTNAGKATITVANGADVTVKNGFVVGGTGYYNIRVGTTVNSTANLTLEDVTATAGNNGSSMIDNLGTLTIESGTYTGGLDVVKSEEGSTLTINGGTFTLNYSTSGYTGVIFAYGTTTITGGEFIQSLTKTGSWDHPQVVATGVVEGHTAITKITGGTFTNNMSGEGIFRGIGKGTSDNFEVSGGTFNKSISDGYCADGFIPTKNADGTYGVKEGKYVAAVGSKKYETLADAIRLAAKGTTVKLLNDVDLPGNVVINKSITLDLNGKKIYNTTDIWHDADENDENDKNIVAMFDIKNGADVIITGNGTVEAKQNDCYNFNIVKGSLTIENGTFIGNVSAVQVQNGHLAIKGGKFDLLQKWKGKSTFLINCIDDAYHDGTAKVSISGGTFVDFNPANNEAEGAGTNFLATGYITTKVGDNYVVKANANKNITDLDTAIGTIQNETSSKNDKNAAVDVIKNIDNADLANNSAAMGKLAALDNTLTTKDSETGSAKVTVTGESTVAGIATDKVEVTNAALSADLTSTTAQNVVVTIANNDNITNNAVEAAKNAAGITDDVAVQKLNISMTVNGETVEKPTAPVVLEFPLPAEWKGCQIVCVDNANNPEVIPTTVIGNTVKATFNHFSDYVMVQSLVITSPNKYQINLTPVENAPSTVYAGDEITYNIELKQINGEFTDKIAHLRFKPESSMLEVSGTPTLNEGFKYRSNGEISFDDNNGISLNSNTHTLSIGTITFKAKAYQSSSALLAVTADDQSTVSNTGGNYRENNLLTVIMPSDVYYKTLKVSFTNFKEGEAGTKVTEYYTKAGSKDLYAKLDDLVKGNAVTSIPEALNGSITGGTQYRLFDDKDANNLNNWVAADTDGTRYVDLIAANGNGFTQTINFNVKRVELLEVKTLPTGVEITSKPTVRAGTTYVDKNAEFTFTVPSASDGLKNDVTVTVKGDPQNVTQDDNKYTVSGADMSASPVEITVTSVIDLDESDIRVFGNNEDGFTKYSQYSGADTLVLIKGKSGVKYTLSGTDAPEIFELPEPEDKNSTDRGYGDGFNLAVLVPAPETVTGTLQATMLNCLKDSYDITVVADSSNTKLNAYDFDTNGIKPGFKIDDLQAAYDFSALKDIKWKPTDDLLLKADVLTYTTGNGYNKARDGQVNTDDVDAFLYNYVYSIADRPTDDLNP